MNAVTAMRFKTGASTHPSDLKLNCGGRIFLIRASQRGQPPRGPRCNPRRRHRRQVPGRVTVNRLAKGSLLDPRGIENAVDRINVGTMSQSEEVAPRAQKPDLSGRARRPGFSAGRGQM